MLIPILTAITLLVGGAFVLGGALVVTRRARLAMDERVGLVARANAAAGRGGAYTATLHAKAKKLDARIRRIFAFGIERSWAMRAGSLTLIVVATVSTALAWFLLSRTFGFSTVLWAPGCLLAAVLPARTLLIWQQRRVERMFMDVFPDAVDSVARMLRAGLPATLAIRTVGNEAAAPVSTVFAMIADQMRIGIPLGEALDASSKRIGLADFRFFSVAVALQHSTGGNLVNTLDVLSQIMRKRRAVRLKAKAVTSEIRLSAYVLGSLPIVTGAALLIIQPGYLTPLVNDPRGHLILGVAAAGLLLSVLAMRMMMRSVSSE